MSVGLPRGRTRSLCPSSGAVALAIGLAALLVPLPLAAADYAQVGGNAARTGQVPGSGPDLLDVALSTNLLPHSGSFPGLADPIIVGDHAYLMATVDEDQTTTRTWIDVSQIWRLDLNEATIEPFTSRAYRSELNLGDVRHLVSDGSRLYFVGGGVVEAIPLDDGDTYDWRTPVAVFDPQPAEASPTDAHFNILEPACVAPVLSESHILVACLEELPAITSRVVTATLIDKRDGAVVWQWVREVDAGWLTQAESDDPEDIDRLENGLLYTSPGSSLFTEVIGAARIDDVYVVGVLDWEEPILRSVGDFESARGSSWWVIQANTGSTTASRSYPVSYSVVDIAAEPGDEGNVMPAPTGINGTLFTKNNDLERFRILANGNVNREATAPDVPSRRYGGDPGVGLVLTEDTVYGTSRYQIQSFTHDFGWKARFLLGGGEQFVRHVPIVTDDQFYVVADQEVAGGTLYALDADTLQGLASAPFDAPPKIALSNGRLVAVTDTGEVRLFGQTPASIHLAASISDLAPAPGDLVTLDMRGTVSPVFGPAEEFRVDWGDGIVTDWTTDSILRHTFNQPGTYTATVQARNQGQISTDTYVFNVQTGGRLNFMQQAFSDQYQDTTWGVIGILLTLIGAAFALLARRQRRSRLQSELAAIDAIYERTRDRPAECLAGLRSRHVHVRQLLLDDAINDGHYAVLERHILERQSAVRMRTLDRECDFLPLKIARTLERFLMDGRITAWERDQFKASLEGEPALTKTQRKKVARLVEEWFAHDTHLAGGGAP